MIRHLVWNVDGVLFDTLPAVTYAISQSLNALGHSIALNVVDALARQSLDFCVDTLAARFKLDPALLRQRSAEQYRRIPPERQPPFPGAREICAWMAARGGVNLIATRRSLPATHALLTAHNMANLFTDILYLGQDCTGKPEPAILLAALQKYALDPGETLLLGRHEGDLQAGQAVGMLTCWFGAEEMASQPTVRVTDYDRLLHYLKTQPGENVGKFSPFHPG